VSSPPARLKDAYLIGRAGSYLAPTVETCDHHLGMLRHRLADAAISRPAVEHDIDLVLDRRSLLVFAQATAEALELANDA
jgi:hypothetical protein